MRLGAARTLVPVAAFVWACSDSGTTSSTGTVATTGGQGGGATSSTSMSAGPSSSSTTSTGSAGSGGGSGTGGGGAGGAGGGATDAGPVADAPSDANGGGRDSDAAGGLTPAGSPCVAGMTYGNPLPANPMAMMIRSGFSFLEGPVWIASQNALYFSDFTLSAPTGSPGKIQKYTPGSGMFEEWLTMPATNGLAIDERGFIVATSQQLQKVIRFDVVSKQQTNVTGGDMYNGQPFNCLNDVVVRSDGNIYFTDPNYQKGGRAGQPDTSYFRLSPAGVLTRIGARTQPNGISLSPDGQYLYVSSAEANGGGIKRHQLAADGSVMNPAMDFSPLPSDGMAVDCGGNLYLVVNGAVTVVSPAGQQIGRIGGLPSGADFVTNAAFGGPQSRTLFITSAMTLHQIVLNIPGLPN